MESPVRRRRGSPPILITLAVAAAAAALTTAVAFSLHPAPVGETASSAGALAPVPESAQSARQSQDPSLPAAAKVFEHPPARDDGDPSTF
jgi:hypothetical protein